MIIDLNTTAVDVALNLSGSITGFPLVIEQLPVGRLVGLASIPDLWDDVDDIGQTWTPYIQGMDLDFTTPIYNTLGVEKQPYTTDLIDVETCAEWGNAMLRQLSGVRLATELATGEDIQGYTFKFKRIDLNELRLLRDTPPNLFCSNNIGSIYYNFFGHVVTDDDLVENLTVDGSWLVTDLEDIYSGDWNIPDGFRITVPLGNPRIVQSNQLYQLRSGENLWDFNYVEVYKEN